MRGMQRGKIPAYQHLALQARFAELRRGASNVDEDVVGVGVGHVEAHVAEGGDDAVANLGVLPHFPIDVFRVLERGDRSYRAQHVDVAHAPGAADPGQGLLLGEAVSDTQARNAMRLREGTGDEHALVLQRQGHRGLDAAGPSVVDVGLVDVNHGVRRFTQHAAHETLDGSGSVYGAGGVVRIAEIDQACAARRLRQRLEIDGERAVQIHLGRLGPDASGGAQAGRVGGHGGHEALGRRAECPHRALQQGGGASGELHVVGTDFVVVGDDRSQLVDVIR